MPKELVAESRNDFRGGLNVYISPDLLASNELSQTLNTRIDTNGPIVKRKGTRRMHQTALASASIKGITQWDGPSGSQIVAICNGDLFYRNQSGGEYSAFTQVDPGATDAFSTTSPALFTALRGTASGAPLYLYIASGGKLYQWTGTTLTRIDNASTSSVGQFGPDASLIATYHLRLFTNTLVRPQNIVWSRLGDGTNFKGGLAGDGGTAIVNAIEADSIVALQTIGRSLLVFTNNSIARIAGYSAEDIRIDQDTEGVSAEVGAVGPLAVVRADRIVFFMSEKGPYIATEDAITPVGLKVQPIFEAMDRTQLSNIVVGHHHGRSEIWIAYAGPNDNGQNRSILIFNLRHQSWYGPFELNWATGTQGITCLESYKDPNGDNFIIAGSTDGFVRHLDYGSRDDRLWDDSGGSSFGHAFSLAPFFFGQPETVFASRMMFTQAKVATSTALSYSTTVKPGSGAVPQSIMASATFLDTGTIVSYKSYPFDQYATGQRMIVAFNGTEDNFPEVHAITIYAHNMSRTW